MLFIWTVAIDANIYPPMLINFLALNIVLCAFFTIPILLNWKNSIILKRIKINGVSKFHFILVLYLIFIPLFMISVLFNMLIFFILTKLGIHVLQSFLSPIIDFVNVSLGNFTAYTLIISFFILVMFAMFLFSILLIVIFKMNKNSYIRLTLFGFLLFTLIFSDIIVNSQMSSQWEWMVIIGYFSPGRYFMWFALFINSYANIDPLGMTQIIDYVSGQASFPKMWIPSLISIILLSISTPISFKLFNWR